MGLTACVLLYNNMTWILEVAPKLIFVSEISNNLSLFLPRVIYAILACCVLLYGIVVTCTRKYLSSSLFGCHLVGLIFLKTHHSSFYVAFETLGIFT